MAMQYEGMVYRPPSEARSFILQVTIGCSNNSCTFCSMYKDKKFRIRTFEEIKSDVEWVAQTYGRDIAKIFLADGDALTIPTDELVRILALLHENFPYSPRITSYGTPGDVLRKTDEELSTLREAGLEMVYMGAESGDDEVLAHVKKNATADEIAEAGIRLRKAGIKVSITLISGLGGKARLREHAERSADLISRIKPEYASFLTLMLEEPAPIIREIESGEMELLSPDDVADEMEIFLRRVDSEGTVFRANHASNYIMLKGDLNGDIPDMIEQIEDVRRRRGYRKESWRRL
ncbi:MAG: radical SAM protein [Anaerovoracaceae bacterium]|jgi:radical SAM superfamily enzyme YgiQ (UPF0313 family)